MKQIEKALQYAQLAHSGQVRKFSKRSYFDHHIIPIYNLLKEYQLPEYVIVAGILHDTVEDTHITFTDIEKEFDQDVYKIVHDMTKVYDSNDSPEQKSESEYLRWVEIDNHYSKLVKCADIITNISDSCEMTPDSFNEKFKKSKQKLFPVLKIDHPLYQKLEEILK